jgi:hypothetical protein
MVHYIYIYKGIKWSSFKFIVLRKIMKHKCHQAFLYTFYLKFVFKMQDQIVKMKIIMNGKSNLSNFLKKSPKHSKQPTYKFLKFFMFEKPKTIKKWYVFHKYHSRKIKP